MGSLTFDGIQFVVYSNDHPPRHIHGFLSETEVIVDLLPNGDVMLADRKDAIRPRNAKRSDIRKVLLSAAFHFEALVMLWDGVHGET